MTTDDAWIIVAATGPRHFRFFDWQGLKTITVRELRRVACALRDERGMLVGLSGMASGVDLWWADAVVRAGCALGAYYPCPDQAAKWKDREALSEWKRLSGLADPQWSKTVSGWYHGGCLNERNERMLGDADAVVSVFLPWLRSGGTWHAMGHAHTLGMPGVTIYPADPPDGRGRHAKLALPNFARPAGEPEHLRRPARAGRTRPAA